MKTNQISFECSRSILIVQGKKLIGRVDFPQKIE